MRHTQARYAATTLLALMLAACGGGGGGSPTTSSTAGAAPPPGAPPSSAGAPPPATIPPSLAGPSILAGGAAGTFDAATLPPGASVTVVIRQPDGTETARSAMVDAGGRLSQEITPASGGLHTVRVLDSSGRELAAANFISH